jgi:hypothetical protein
MLRPIGRVGITYSAEVSSDLVNWSSAILAGPPSSNGDGTEIVVFRDVLSAGQVAARFIRLRIDAF